MVQVTIDARFCGPPGCAHGGYVAGVLANHSDRSLRVRLLAPTPLQRALQLRTHSDGAVELLDAERLLVRGDPLNEALQLQVPPAPERLLAVEASRSFIGLRDHAFPNCFVCGTARPRGDGLRIFAGRVPAGRMPGGELVAAPWNPDASIAGEDGKVLPQFITAALDCPGYFAARSDGVPMLLGEFSAHVDRRVHVDEPCVLIGWRIAAEGRRYRVGTALFDEDGELCARATGTWIEPRGGLPKP
jgi:hypothetical protein